MPKSNKSGFYAVKKGVTPGIYRDWATAEPLVRNFPGALHKKFSTLAEAEEWIGFKVDSAKVETSSSTSNTSPNRFRPYTSPNTGSRVTLTKKPKEEDVQDESGWDVVYTDGSCTGNGGPGAKAGIGVWWGHDDPRNLSERCPGDQTNNRAELIAIIRALETTPDTGRPLLIKTDSSYSIQCVRDWLPRWQRNGFRTGTGAKVKNVEVIRFLSHLLGKRRKVKLQHIKGHAGHEGNEGADFVAQRGTWFPAIPDRDWTIVEDKSPEHDPISVKPIPDSQIPAVTVPQASSKQTPRSVVTSVSPEDLNNYADCLLSAEELANEEF